MEGLLAVKLKLGVDTLLKLVGLAVMVVSGAVLSITKFKPIALNDKFPAVSIAKNLNACVPLESAGVVNGEVHAVKVVVSVESIPHLKVEVSLAVNPKVGVLLFEGEFGEDVNDGIGLTVSIIHVYVAGLASTLPTVSVARTWKLCDPSASAGVVNGEVHAANAPESTEHSKVEASLAVKPKLDVDNLLGLVGLDVNVVSGAAVSIVIGKL